MKNQKYNNIRPLQILVKWLNKTQGRDKLCKMIQYSCLILACYFKQHDYYSLQFETLFQTTKQARKLFRLFKSVFEYQKLVAILLDDDDNLLKIFRVLGQVFFFLYWFFDNISILCKIKLLRGNYTKNNVIASTFWALSLLVAVPVLAIESRNAKINHQKRKILSLDCIKYTFDLLPALNDSLLYRRIFKSDIKREFAAVGGLVSSIISTYQVFEQC